MQLFESGPLGWMCSCCLLDPYKVGTMMTAMHLLMAIPFYRGRLHQLLCNHVGHPHLHEPHAVLDIF